MTANKNSEGKKHSDRIGIKWKMFALLVLLTAISILIVWIFLIQMANHFYQRTKFRELNFSDTAIASALGKSSEDLNNTVDMCSDEYSTDIWIYEIKGDMAYLLVQAPDDKEREIKFIDSHMIAMYQKANTNDGRYIAVVPLDHFEERIQMDVISDNMGHPEEYPSYKNHSDILSAISLTIHEVGGKRYAILQESTLTPLGSMLKTLKDQFVWIGFILSIVVLVFADIMSRLITKPFIKMNRAAKELAHGHYDVEFSGHGYREINELADTLNYAACELSRNDELKEELIANVSHDLRTPLTMIKGYSEVMRDIPGENTPENVQVIIDETERLADLVNDMLDLSKIQSGTRKPELEIFSLTDTVRSTMQRYEKLTMQDGYRIEFIASGNVDICADRGMILQVIYNLINNAIHYTGEDLCVTVKQTVSGDTVRISVIDTGDGIPAEQIPLIWDRYYKIDKVHKRARIGTGLGLSIVKGILELHGASYGVDSILGHGSTFWFELTAATAELVDTEVSE